MAKTEKTAEDVDKEEVFMKVCAIFAFGELLAKWEEEIPALSKREQSGFVCLCQDILKDLELVVYGKKFWRDSEDKPL